MSGHTPGPWSYVPSTEHHGPYVTSDYGSTVCDCYTMSHPGEMSTRNGGRSKPVHFMHEMADANARLIAAAPEMLEALQHIAEYWNRDQNETAMADALWHIIETAEALIAKAEGRNV